MSAYEEVKAWKDDIFTLLGEEWALVTAGNEEKSNTMTVSWGGIGVLWGKPTMTLYIRPQRFTKEFMDAEDYVTLSFLEEGHKKDLAFCGKHSGRDLDKFEETGLNPAFLEEGNTPYIQDAKLVILGKKRAVMPMVGDVLPDEVKTKWYPQEDYHLQYFYEVVQILKKR